MAVSVLLSVLNTLVLMPVRSPPPAAVPESSSFGDRSS
jgi:hypothetical protein